MSYKSTLLMHEFVTHDTRRFILSRPEGLRWTPGQGMELAIDTPDWRDRGHPFTPTSLERDRVLEFVIKRYPGDGLTPVLHDLKPGAALLLSEPFGSISYQGPGVFLAGGTGITPFLAILRELALRGELAQQALFFSNKSEEDVICGEELRHLLGERCRFTFTREHDPGQDGHHLDVAFLSGHLRDLDRRFYVCGPPGFVTAMEDHLITLGVHPDRLIYES